MPYDRLFPKLFHDCCGIVSLFLNVYKHFEIVPINDESGLLQ